MNDDIGKRIFYFGKLFFGQSNFRRAEILPQPFLLPHTGDGNDEGVLVQHPCKEDLGGGCPFGCRHISQHLQQGLVGLHILRGEAGDDPAHVITGVDIPFPILPAQEAAGHGGKGHEANAQLPAGGDDLCLKHPLHHGVLALNG